ncbi:MYCBP-associated protein-like, partial [Argonauta hians]
IIVAKLAKPDAQVQPNTRIEGEFGPAFDDIGRVIPYTIAGTFEDFCSVATKYDIPVPRVISKPASSPKTSLVASETPTTIFSGDKQALNNWMIKNEDQKLQQRHLCGKTERNPTELVMNRGENPIRREGEPEVSENIKSVTFWKQQPRFGDPERGIHATLTLSETCRALYEQVGISQMIREEKGLCGFDGSSFSEDACSITDVRQKKGKRALNSFMPEFQYLQVKGRPIPETVPPKAITPEQVEPVVGPPEERMWSCTDDDSSLYAKEFDYNMDKPLVKGPALLFDGKTIKWHTDSKENEKRLDFLLYFEAFLGEKILVKENPFNPGEVKKQIFYYNNSNGKHW